MIFSLLPLLTNFAAACNLTRKSFFLGIPPWYKYLKGETLTGSDCSVQFAFPADLGKIGLAVVEAMLRIGGLVAVIFVVYGGILYIMSQGDVGPGNVPKSLRARHVVINALIGAILASLGTFIVQLLATNLT